MKTYIANAIDIAGVKSRYDKEVIKLLSDKKVLSWILKYTTQEFSTYNYNGIKKVYSIWIFMEPPKYARNTITEYHIQQNRIYGDFSGAVRYDLLSAVIVCLGKDENDFNGTALHKMLNTLLSTNLSPIEKQKILEEKFNFRMNRNEMEGVETMCNLSDLIEERAIGKGIKQGLVQGLEQGIELSIKNTIGILRDMNESDEQIISRILSKFDVSAEVIKKYL